MLQRTKTEREYDAESARIQGQLARYNDEEHRALRFYGSMFHGATTGAGLAYNVAATGREEGWWNLA